MSINVTIAVPLETIEAIQGATSTAEKHAAADSLSNREALIAAIDAFPFQIKSKAAVTAEASQPIEFFDITILTLTGKKIPLRVSTLTTIWNLRTMIQDREGIAPNHMHLIWGGRVLSGKHYDDFDEVKERRTLGTVSSEIRKSPEWSLEMLTCNAQYGIGKDALLHLVLTIRGS